VSQFLTKIPEKNNIEEERLILAHGFRGSIAVGLR
jgi:hypothetical protein